MHLNSRSIHLHSIFRAALAGFVSMQHAPSSPHKLPTTAATVLDEELARALKQSKPLVVMVSLHSCLFSA